MKKRRYPGESRAQCVQLWLLAGTQINAYGDFKGLKHFAPVAAPAAAPPQFIQQELFA